MADFCYDCTKDILGINPEMNDFNLTAEHSWCCGCKVLCEGCGFITVDHEGKKISDTDLRPDNYDEEQLRSFENEGGSTN